MRCVIRDLAEELTIYNGLDCIWPDKERSRPCRSGCKAALNWPVDRR